MSTRKSHPVALRRKALPRCSVSAVAAARFWPQGCPPALALALFHDLHRLQSPGLLAQNRWETLHRETVRALSRVQQEEGQSGGGSC